MNIQPNTYELNKIYRQDQELRSEKIRQAEATQAKTEKRINPVLVQLLGIIK
jgi:hypothetical protein